MTVATGISVISVGTVSSVVSVEHPGRKLFSVDNPGTIAVGVAFGAVATLGTAGSYLVDAGQTRVWEHSFISPAPIAMIASAPTSVTVEEA